GPESARCTESISTPAISSASSIAFLIDSTADSRLTTTPRRMPRDSATPSPTTSRPSPSRISATTAVTLDVPTSRPTRYRSLRATLPPGPNPNRHSKMTSRSLHSRARLPFRVAAAVGTCGLRRLGRPHVNPIVKSQIDVVDVRHARAQGRRQFQIRFEPRDEPVVADVNHRLIAVQDHARVVLIGNVDLRQTFRQT